MVSFDIHNFSVLLVVVWKFGCYKNWKKIRSKTLVGSLPSLNSKPYSKFRKL